MNFEKIVDSVKFFDFLNKIDELINELLYSQKEGYFNLKNKLAIDNIENYSIKFENAFAKISSEFNIDTNNEIYEEKKADFIAKINAHRDIELNNWIEKVYSNFITGCLKEIELNKQNNEKVQKYVNRGYLIIDWLFKVKNINKNEKEKLINEFKKDLDDIFSNKKETDEKILTKSDYKTYFKIRDMITEDIEKFIQLDLETLKNKLIQDDIIKFNLLKNSLKTQKKTEIIDEIKLINSAIKILKLKNNKEEYEFIKDIENDLLLASQKNKDFGEEEKIKITKKRISIKQNPLYYEEKLKNSI